MSTIYAQARLVSLVLAQDSLVRMADNETDPKMADAINNAIHALDTVLSWSYYRESAERPKEGR